MSNKKPKVFDDSGDIIVLLMTPVVLLILGYWLLKYTTIGNLIGWLFLVVTS